MQETPRHTTTAEANKELPTFNPARVKIKTDATMEIIHGFTNGSIVHTTKKEIGSRDNNDFDIWVMSPLQNREVWLSSNHYELIKDEGGE